MNQKCTVHLPIVLKKKIEKKITVMIQVVFNWKSPSYFHHIQSPGSGFFDIKFKLKNIGI